MCLIYKTLQQQAKIILSTQPCNLHRQTLAVEWPYWTAQWLSTWHRHRMPPFQQVSSSNFCPAVKWKRLGATTAQLRSGSPHQLTERDCRVLKRVNISCLRLQQSLPSKLPQEATSAQDLFVGRIMKWVSMAEQLQDHHVQCQVSAGVV